MPPDHEPELDETPESRQPRQSGAQMTGALPDRPTPVTPGSAPVSGTSSGPESEAAGTNTTPEPTPEPTVDTAEPAEKQWWDDPRMPWKGKPGRRDIALWIAFSLTGVYTLVLLPLRPILIGHLPLLLVALSGSRSGLVTIGALSALGRADWWWVGWILGSISLIKFDPIFFFAGRFWGRGLIEVFGGRSKRAARNTDRAERLARRYGIAAIVFSYVVPIPSAVIFATLGAAGMRLRTFIAVDLVSAFAINALWLYLGHRLGQRAVDVVNVIARYSTWFSLALIAFIVISAIWGARRKAARETVAQD